MWGMAQSAELHCVKITADAYKATKALNAVRTGDSDESSALFRPKDSDSFHVM